MRLHVAFAALVVCSAPVVPVDYVPAVRADRESITWTVDIDATCASAIASAVHGAADAWAVATSGACPFAFAVSTRDDLGTLEDELPIGRVVLVTCEHGRPFARWRDEGGARVRLDFPGDIAARHELGHAFGLDHDAGGIMWQGGAITRANAEDVCP